MIVKDNIREIRDIVLNYTNNFFTYNGIKEVIYFGKRFDKKSFFDFLYKEVLSDLKLDLSDVLTQMKLLEKGGRYVN